MPGALAGREDAAAAAEAGRSWRTGRTWRSRRRRAGARWARRLRARRTRRPSERLQRHRQLHLRRLGARRAHRISCGPMPAPSSAPYNRQNFGGTVGGPLKIPGLYDGTRRTNFTVDLQRQPRRQAVRSVRHGADARRCAPATSRRLRDAADRSSAPGSRSPATRFPSSRSVRPPARCCRTSRRPISTARAATIHYTTTTDSVGDTLNRRITHNFTPAAGGRGRRTGRRSAAAAAEAGGRGGRGQQGTSVLAQRAGAVPPQRHGADQRVPDARRHSNDSSSLAMPVSLNVAHRRTLHNVIVNVSRTSVVLGQSLRLRRGRGRRGRHHRRRHRSVRLGRAERCRSPACRACAISTPSRRTDRRVTRRPTPGRGRSRQHTLRLGGDYRCGSTSQQPHRSPTPAARSSSPASILRRRPPTRAATASTSPTSCSACRSRRSLQYGPGDVRAARPLDEPVRPGRLAQDATPHVQPRRCATSCCGRSPRITASWSTSTRRPDFTAVAPVVAGGTGPYTGKLPERAALDRHQQHRAARRRRLALQARRPSSAAATASASTPGRIRPSRGSWSASRRSRSRAPRSARSRNPQPHRSAGDGRPRRDHEQLRRRSATTRSAPSRPGTSTSRGTCGRSGTSARGYTHTRGVQPRHPARAQSRSRPVSASRTCSRSSGSRRRDRRVLHAAHVPRCGGDRSRASAAASPTRSPARATTPRRSAAAHRSSRRTIRTWPPSGGSRASIAAIS